MIVYKKYPNLQKICESRPKIKVGTNIYIINKKLKQYYTEPIVKIDFSYSTVSGISGYVSTKDEVDKDNNCYMFSKYGNTWVFTQQEAETLIGGEL